MINIIKETFPLEKLDIQTLHCDVDELAKHHWMSFSLSNKINSHKNLETHKGSKYF